MARTAAHVVNPVCGRGDHDACPHKVGVEMTRIGRKGQMNALLCTCSCHGSCPVKASTDALDQEWMDSCSCPGSELIRIMERQTREKFEARKARQAEVLESVDVGRGRSAKDIQQDILASYEEHGYEPLSDFSRWSRFIAAGTARRGTRTLRLLGEAVLGIRAARRWSPEPPDQVRGLRGTRPDRNLPELERRNKSELRTMGLTAAGLWAASGSAAAGAYLTGSLVSVVLAVMAAAFAALAAWVSLWYVGINTVMRIGRNYDRSLRRPRAGPNGDAPRP